MLYYLLSLSFSPKKRDNSPLAVAANIISMPAVTPRRNLVVPPLERLRKMGHEEIDCKLHHRHRHDS